MEQDLNPDQLLGNNAEHEDKPASSQPPVAAGATDIFGTVAATPVSEKPTVVEVALEHFNPPPPIPEPEVNRGSMPVVHEVVFKSEHASFEDSDPMMKILRAAPPAPKPAEPVVPVVHAAPSSGGFTQLLRALSYEQQVKPAEQAKPVEPVSPVAPAPIATVPPPPPVAVGSITQLLRTIDEPTAAEPPPPAVVEPIAETPVQAAIRAMEEGRPAAAVPAP